MNPRHHSGHHVSGIVTSVYPPFSPLEDVHVHLPAVREIALTDRDGHFEFNLVPPGTHTVWAEKAGYRPDSQTVVVQEGVDPSPLLFRLDALPRIENPVITTTHISRWWPPDDLYILSAQANVWDPDGPGDVMAIWLECEPWGKIDALVYQPGSRAFAAEIVESSLPSGSLVALEGHRFHIFATDRLEATSKSEPLFISRIIRVVPVIESPQGYAETAPQPWLRWKPAEVPFPHTWAVEIFRIEGGLVIPTWKASELAQDSTRVRPPLPLLSGSYYWVLWLVDEWGNRSRSKEGAFKVP